jgi:predicted phage-related endonuclease
MLTAAQLKAREGKLTASRVACLMKGDAAEIMRLYRELTNQEAPEDLSHVWPVRLGEATEQLNLDWYEAQNGPLSRRGEVVTHPKYDWAAATLDGWDDRLGCPIETKHVGGREPLEVIIERYQPQMQWQMECTGATECGLSVIMGASPPIVEFIERDADYAAEMVKRGLQFISCVKQRIEPVVLPAIAAPIDATKIYDMAGNNQWATSAVDWLSSKPAADICKDAEKILKSLVPEDAKKCHGHDIQITRDRAGRLSLREAKQ